MTMTSPSREATRRGVATPGGADAPEHEAAVMIDRPARQIDAEKNITRVRARVQSLDRRDQAEGKRRSSASDARVVRGKRSVGIEHIDSHPVVAAPNVWPPAQASGGFEIVEC